MIEANENIDLVTMRRQQEMRQAKESYQQAVAEGRLVEARSVIAPYQTHATSSSIPYGALGDRALPVATEVQPVETAPQPKDPEVAWRHTRLAVTAGLVLLLLVVWIWQKRAGR